MSFKKTVRRSLRVIAALSVLISLVIAFTLNVIFTSEKVTPIIVNLLNDQLRDGAEIQSEGIELTFFSTFPRFGAKLNNTYIKSSDSNSERDTLASFKQAIISFDIYQYLKHQDISIKKARIDQPRLYAYIDKEGRSNWDILKKTAASEPDSTASDSLIINDISVDHFEINDATLSYEDGATDIIHQVNSFSLQVQAEKNETQLQLAVMASSDDVTILLHQQPVYHVNHIDGEFDLDYDRNRGTVLVSSKDITINKIHFQTNGILTPLPKENRIEVHLESQLTTNSIEHLVALVPPHILKKSDIKTTGELRFGVGINGSYGRGNLPVIDFKLNLDNGSLEYSDFPGKISALQTSMEGLIDPNDSIPSFVKVDKLIVKGTGIDINGHGQANDILNNAQTVAQLTGAIDLSELYAKFPLDTNLMLKGKAHVDFSAEFSMDQIERKKYEQLNLAGNINLDHVVIKSALDSLEFYAKKVDLDFYRDTKKYPRSHADLQLDSTVLHYKNTIDFSAKTLLANGVLNSTKDKKPIIKLVASMEDVTAGSTTDSVDLALRRAKLVGEFLPGDAGKSATVTSDFTIDSLGIRLVDNKLGMLQGNYHLVLSHQSEKKWLPKGTVKFKSLTVRLPQLQTPIYMPATKLSFVNDDFTLDHAKLRFGETSVDLSGRIEHLLGFQTGNMVTASLVLESDFINTNQLMTAFAGISTATPSPSDSLTKVVTLADTTSHKHVFAIPDSLQFEFKTRIGKLLIGESYFNDIAGNLEIHDGNMYLKDFKLKTLAADLNAEVTYTAKTNKLASIDYAFYLTRIEMNKLNEFLPLLDSLFPMTKSFVGKVDFRMKGSATLDENLDFDMSSVKGVGALQARNIMLLDGPTFRDLAKTFMFKNKDLNPIEQFDAEMEFEQNKVNILPAVMEIDRYKLAIGGVQNLDMSYDYHISVLESPVPFKTGVDISGEGTDFNFKVSKAKYKFYFSDKERLQNKADTLVISRKKDILKDLGL